MRNQFENLNGRVGPAKSPDWVSRAIGDGQAFRKDYSNTRVRVLVLLELPRFPETYQPKDEQERALVEKFVERGRVIVGRWTDKLKRAVPDAKIVDIPSGGHSMEAQVLREIEAFITRMPAGRYSGSRAAH